jgi:hypothetical protein
VYPGKHLLNIYASEQGSSVEFLRDYPFALSFMETAVGDTSEVTRFIEQIPERQVDRDLVEQMVSPFQAETISRQCLNLMEVAQVNEKHV